nr:IS1-like element transposase [Endozoicomonas montiporae]
MLEYRYKACEPGVKEKIIDMAINGSGIRDTSKVLGISKTTVIKTLKKRKRSGKGQPKYSNY